MVPPVECALSAPLAVIPPGVGPAQSRTFSAGVIPFGMKGEMRYAHLSRSYLMAKIIRRVRPPVPLHLHQLIHHYHSQTRMERWNLP